MNTNQHLGDISEPTASRPLRRADDHDPCEQWERYVKRTANGYVVPPNPRYPGKVTVPTLKLAIEWVTWLIHHRWRRTIKTHVAVHEAGHAVIARVLGIDVRHVDVFFPGRSAIHQWGQVVYGSTVCDCLRSDADPATKIGMVEKEIKYTIAGSRAEQKHDPRADPFGSSGDYARLRSYASWIIDGGPKNTDPYDYAAIDHPAIEPAIDRLVDESAALVDQHWLAIMRVARALVRRNRLTGAEVDKLILRTARRSGGFVGKIGKGKDGDLVEWGEDR
jgi:hypothetical protein